jgi:hypothetical protein
LSNRGGRVEKNKIMKVAIIILGLVYLSSCGVILYHTMESFGVKYKGNIELQKQFVAKMKKHFTLNLSLLAGILIIVFIKMNTK